MTVDIADIADVTDIWTLMAIGERRYSKTWYVYGNACAFTCKHAHERQHMQVRCECGSVLGCEHQQQQYLWREMTMIFDMAIVEMGIIADMERMNSMQYMLLVGERKNCAKCVLAAAEMELVVPGEALWIMQRSQMRLVIEI